jgi:hypothetical protein
MEISESKISGFQGAVTLNQSSAESTVPLSSGGNPFVTSNESEPAPAAVPQILNRAVGGLFVIHQHRISLEAFDYAIHEDYGELSGAKAVEVGPFLTGRDNNHAVYLLFEQQVHRLLFTASTLPGVEDDHGVSIFREPILYPLRYAHEEHVRNFGSHQPHGESSFVLKTSRYTVHLVVQLFDDRFHSGAGGGGDTGVLVYDPRHGGCTYPSLTGNILNRWIHDAEW